jgi:glycosyltransferase involved in cell wall biosynthesis
MRIYKRTLSNMNSGNVKCCVAVVFQQFSPYHVDRLSALEDKIGRHYRVVGIEYSDRSSMYAWEPTPSNAFERITLFPGKDWEQIHPLKRMVRLLHCLVGLRAKHVFLINYHLPDIVLTAVTLRLLRVHPYVMMASRFKDKNRTLLREMLKAPLFLPYRGGLASGKSHAEYLRFLGFHQARVVTGLDTVSLHRIRAKSGIEPAPNGVPFPHRHFTVIARMVREKDFPTVIKAYALYLHRCKHEGIVFRRLVLCGDGPERANIEQLVRQYDITSVEFKGFVQELDICNTLGSTLALILASTEEPWGLVINEAIAMGVPVLCTEACGASDELVRVGVNGYVFSDGEVEGLAQLMLDISRDHTHWQRLSLGALNVAPKADAARFACSVLELIEPDSKY